MDYKEKREENENYRLRKRGEDREAALKGYEASEKERKEEAAPRERLRAESQKGFLSAGFSGEKKEKVVLLVSQDKDPQASREEKKLKKEGARPQKVEGKRVLTNSHDPRRSAALFELDSAKNKKRLISEIAAMMEKKGSETVSGLLPYLEEKEQREEIKALEEEARTWGLDPGLAVRNRHLAGALREDLRKKEEQKVRLLKLLETNLSREQEQAPRFPWELLLGMAAASQKEEPEAPAETGPEAEEEPDQKEAEAKAPEPAGEQERTSLFSV